MRSREDKFLNLDPEINLKRQLKAFAMQTCLADFVTNTE